MKIGILGGGTAGYLTALAFKKHVPDAIVEVIAANDIPPIGVGESTFPQIVGFIHEYLGLDPVKFYEEVQPTWKLGTKFIWGQPGEHWFNFPFDTTNHKAAHCAGFDVRRGSLMAVLMDDEKTFVVRGDSGEFCIAGSRHQYAYQLDNRRLIAYLRDQVLAAGIPIVDAQINHVDVDENRTNVRALHSADERSFAYDLYVDCSGFRSVLLKGALGVRYVDYRTSLYTDSAVIGPLPNGGRIQPYTTCRVMDHGWMWLISMREEDHLGYVFSSAHCSTEEAVAEFEGKTGVKAHPHVLRFPSGRHEVAWKGNVVAIGNAYAFVEPLQATGIQMILSAIRRAVQVLSGQDERQAAVRRYNDASNTKWDFIRGFIAMHYRYNKRGDTTFWQDCRRDVDLAGIEPLIEYFHQHGLLSLADPETRESFSLLWDAGIFGTNGVDLILLGMGEKPGPAPRDSVTHEGAWFHRKRAVWNALSKQALTQRQALTAMEHQLHALLA